MKKGPSPLPTELWAEVVIRAAHGDLLSISRVCQSLNYLANGRIYAQIEVSLGKCDRKYCAALFRTITTSPALAALVRHVVMDANVHCDLVPPKTGPQLSAAQREQERSNLVKAAARVVQNCGIEFILPHLPNLEKFSFNRGAVPNQQEARFHALAVLGTTAGLRLQSLNLDYASLNENRFVCTLFTALRTIDIGYTNIEPRDLQALLSANASTLETLVLRWIVQPPNELLLKSCDAIVLPSLRVLHIQGQGRVDAAGAAALISSCTRLERLQVDDIEDIGAGVWAGVLTALACSGQFTRMRHLSFGGPKTTVVAFWDAVAAFLAQTEDTLESLTLHARQIGVRADNQAAMPPTLAAALFQRPEARIALTTLVLIWRAVVGIPYETVAALAHAAPRVAVLHIYTVYPQPHTVPELLAALGALAYLRRVHVITPHGPAAADTGRWSAFGAPELGARGGLRYPFAGAFLAGLHVRCPRVARASWICHEPWSETPEDCVFVDAQPGRTPYCDLSATYFTTCPRTQRGYPFEVDGMRTMLAQRPTWLEAMGNPLVRDGSVCERAHVGRTLP